jgi:Lrp/AsnC family transcriptional regulator for asnA, asnC and gidA
MYQPDRIDWEIIALLNEDGRMTSAEISRQLEDVSARTVANRIDKLTKHGIVDIRAIVDPEMVGYGVLADVFIEVEPGHMRGVAEHLAGMPQISYAAYATGDTDVIVSVRARSINELYDFVIEKIGAIPGVRHTNTIPLPYKLKSVVKWLPPDALSERQPNSPSDTQPDQGVQGE